VSQDALLEALESPWRPSEEAALKSWLRTITDRVIADFLTQKATRSEYEGKMPAAAVRTDEAGLPVDDPYADDIADLDASVDPRKPSLHTQGFLVRRHLTEVTAKDEGDLETFEIMCEHYDEEKSYEEIARERNIPVGTLRSRVHRFDDKYRDGCEQYRNRMLPLLWLGGAAVVAVVIAVAAFVWGIASHGPKVEPTSTEPPPSAPTAFFVPHPDRVAPPVPSLLPVPPAPMQRVPRLKP
jgi:DNA-directed RNA polymerase specialized sigma24 family protein